ncbi:MAG TPA: ABC transporter permease [Gemmatimonadales bacterium]|nr:ABC transporter permease [Gemmatimonadales bacterium]
MAPSGLRVREMVKKEFRQLLRDPRSRAVMFVAPVIQLVMFGYAVNTDIRDTATWVVDLDRTAQSRALVEAFHATGYFQIVGRSERPHDLADALDDGDALVGIEIPSGFTQKLATGGARVQVIVDGSNSNSATIAMGYAQRIVQRFALDYARTAGQLPGGGVDLRIRAWYNPNLESRMYNVPGVIGIIILLMALILTALAVVRERELGTLDQLMVTPLTARELILGKTLPVGLVALADLVLVSSIAVFWFDIPIRGSPPALLFGAVLYILAGLGVGLFISTISRTQQEAFMSMFMFIVPAIILSGFFYPVSSMPTVFQWITLLNPVRHFLEIVRGIFLKGESVRLLWPQYLALGIMAGAILRLAVGRIAVAEGARRPRRERR